MIGFFYFFEQNPGLWIFEVNISQMPLPFARERPVLVTSASALAPACR